MSSACTSILILALNYSKLNAVHNIVVINAVSGFSVTCMRALMQGLEQRKQETGDEFYFIHVGKYLKLPPIYVRNANLPV